jgi:hypothetical protein
VLFRSYNIAYSVQTSTPGTWGPSPPVPAPFPDPPVSLGGEDNPSVNTIAYLSTYLEIQPSPSFPPIVDTYPGLALTYGSYPVGITPTSIASTANQITVPITVPTTIKLMTLLQSNWDFDFEEDFLPYFGAYGKTGATGTTGMTEEQAVTLIITKVD